MKDGLRYIVGKQVAAVVVAQSDHSPRNQVFLVFSDGSNFELYGESFTCCAGLDRTADIERYVESGNGRITRVYGNAAMLEPARAAAGGPAPAESLESVLQRDLDAWIAAKAAVDAARRRR
jgi:hypothetical protein